VRQEKSYNKEIDIVWCSPLALIN